MANPWLLRSFEHDDDDDGFEEHDLASSKINVKEDEILASTERSLRLLEESEQAGSSTLVVSDAEISFD